GARWVGQRGKGLRGGGGAPRPDRAREAGAAVKEVRDTRRRGGRPASARESTGGGRVPGQKRQPLWVIYRSTGCPYRRWRLTLSRPTTRFFSALQDAFTGRLRCWRA